MKSTPHQRLRDTQQPTPSGVPWDLVHASNLRVQLLIYHAFQNTSLPMNKCFHELDTGNWF